MLPDVDGRKTQDTQSHLCLPILPGPGGPDPASWDETCGQKSLYLDGKDEPMVTEGKHVEGTVGEFRMDMYTLLYLK